MKPSWIKHDYYFRLRNYYTMVYGQRVHRIALDAGFTCPNRDGSKGQGGCTYCDSSGSGAAYIERELRIDQQLAAGKKYAARRYNVTKFLAYFQAFSNTYAPISELERIYNEALNVPDIVGLVIGTRPDTLSRKVLALLQNLSQQVPVWLELGLESSHDCTLNQLNRRHTAQDFFDTVELAHDYSLPVCAHIILGLPGETQEMMHETVDRLVSASIHGIKFHHLYIAANSPIHQIYLNGKIEVFSLDVYVSLIVDILERLPAHIVIYRVMGEKHYQHLIAPQWTLQKQRVLQHIDREFKKRSTYQGRYAPFTEKDQIIQPNAIPVLQMPEQV